MIFNIPLIWSVFSLEHIEADTLEEAVAIAFNSPQNDGEYIDDSLYLDIDGLSIHNDFEIDDTLIQKLEMEYGSF
jgi:hypothetical protein